MIVTGADRESKVQVARYVRPIGAVYNMIGGVSVYKNAVKTTEEMLSTLNASGNLRSLNNILSANGHKTISSVTHANIKDLNSSLVRLGQRAGVIKRQGSMFFTTTTRLPCSGWVLRLTLKLLFLEMLSRMPLPSRTVRGCLSAGSM